MTETVEDRFRNAVDGLIGSFNDAVRASGPILEFGKALILEDIPFPDLHFATHDDAMKFITHFTGGKEHWAFGDGSMKILGFNIKVGKRP